MSTDFNSATWSAADLLSEVYRACALPDTGTVDWTPAAVLREATSVIWSFAGPALAKAREGRLATTLLRAVTGDSVAVSGQDYELPPMALGDAIDSVAWIPAAENRVLPLEVIPLGLEDTYSSPEHTGEPTHFALLDATVRVYPRPSASGSLRVTYQRRHGELVQSSAATTVLSWTEVAGLPRVTLADTPSGFAANVWLDFIGASYPHRTKLHGALVAFAHGGDSFTLDVPYADFVAANLQNDTVTLYGKTPYVQLPMEFRSALVSKVAAKISGVIGDAPMYARHRTDAAEEMRAAKDAISPRTKTARQKAFHPRSVARSALPRGIPRWNRRDG